VATILGLRCNHGIAVLSLIERFACGRERLVKVCLIRCRYVFHSARASQRGRVWEGVLTCPFPDSAKRAVCDEPVRPRLLRRPLRIGLTPGDKAVSIGIDASIARRGPCHPRRGRAVGGAWFGRRWTLVSGWIPSWMDPGLTLATHHAISLVCRSR
jgi:hypothetical protein